MNIDCYHQVCNNIGLLTELLASNCRVVRCTATLVIVDVLRTNSLALNTF